MGKGTQDWHCKQLDNIMGSGACLLLFIKGLSWYETRLSCSEVFWAYYQGKLYNWSHSI